MTQVSRVPLRQDIWERIFDLFISTLVSIKNKKRLEGFVGNLFSPTERIMFAKRLAAAVMVAKGNDYQTIRQVLRISPPTIAKMSFRVKYEGEGLMPVIEDILRKDATKILWEEIKDLFDVPTKGKNWSRMGKRKFKRKIRIQELEKEF